MSGATFGFEGALDCLKHGYAAARDSWAGANTYVCLQVPTRHSKMTKPYLFLRTAEGELVPWLPTYADLFAEDWRVV